MPFSQAVGCWTQLHPSSRTVVRVSPTTEFESGRRRCWPVVLLLDNRRPSVAASPLVRPCTATWNAGYVARMLLSVGLLVSLLFNLFCYPYWAYYLVIRDIVFNSVFWDSGIFIIVLFVFCIAISCIVKVINHIP